jgi:hypothetical protein
MTPSKIKKAGYKVEAYVPGESNDETRRNPWIIRWLGPHAGRYGGRYAKRHEAVAALKEELESADSAWPRAGEP